MIRFKSMQQRFAVVMLLPVGVLLLGMGFAGFTYARNQLLAQWGEAAILKLQRAAHYVDMRLNQPKEMLNLFNASAGMPQASGIQRLILDQLEQIEWVAEVNLEWTERASFSEGAAMIPRHMWHMQGNEGQSGQFSMMPFHRSSDVRVTSPRFDAGSGGETVSLISDLKDANDRTVGHVEVKIRFTYLVETVEATGWWQAHKAFIVEDTGKVLASNVGAPREALAEEDAAMAKSVLNSAETRPFGTVFGKGRPPENVVGFYRLSEAPWVLIIIAPGRQVLSSIINFRVYFFAFGSFFILAILFIIRFVTGKTATSIRNVADAAQTVAGGRYDVSLPVRSDDEVGELIRSFNKMVTQLEERAHLKYSLNLAREVQQNLLPGNGIQTETMDIAGKSIYCDETGGDYYDFLEDSESRQDRVGIAVGDVSDHGIAASLFMTTARALIRSRFFQGGSLARILTDVNRLLCMDTARTGNFMTLFLAVFDGRKTEIRWVRAGHDPAILYDTERDEFAELGGEGMALGVDETYLYKEYVHSGWGDGNVLVIGTDGIWDTVNPAGERFGKERFYGILKNNHRAPAKKIVAAVADALATFRQGQTQGDDVTLVVIKVKKIGLDGF